MGAVRAPLAWIIAPLLRHPCTRALREAYGLSVPEHGTDCDAYVLRLFRPEDLPEPEAEEVLRFTEADTAAYAVKPYLDYPHAYLADPAQQADRDRPSAAATARDEAARTNPATAQRTPNAARPCSRQGARRLTPAEVGTAHHLFMQFCDFETASAPGGGGTGTENGSRTNASCRPEQAAAVDTAKIEAFFYLRPVSRTNGAQSGAA